MGERRIVAIDGPATRPRPSMVICVVVLASGLLMAGCAGRGWFARAAADEDVDFAKRYLTLFQSRSYPAIEMGMDPSLKDPQMRLKLVQMASVFPPGEPTSLRLVGSWATVSGNTTTSNLSFQYQYPGRWILAEVIVERKGQAPVVKGVHIEPLRDSLDRINRLTLAGKRPAHYVMLVASVAVAAFVLYAFVLAVRTPAPSMQWAWALFVLVGFVQVSLNWTTGGMTFLPMGMQLFGSGFTRPSPFDPLVITTSIPVGAIVYLIQRREWREPQAPAGTAP